MDSRSLNLRGFAGSAGNIMQGIGGFVFGNENATSSEDSYVERYLDRINNGARAEDRRAAMTELQSLVAESRQAQISVGAIGFPVLLHVLREDREDVELIRGALETLVSSLTPIETSNGPKNEVQPAPMNSDLLSRESENISLLLSLLSEDDFYVRYYTLQLLTALITNSPKRLQEAILSIPRGITVLMDMLMDREVIRNEALLLLTYLTREAEEIKKIVAFEGAFEKIFSIIKEEGGSDGGVVVQDCLELLKNLIRNNASNQILLRETIGYDPLVSILKLRRGSAYNFTQQKTVNLLYALETVELLLISGCEPGKDNSRQANQTAFAQKKILDHLLLLGVESPWAPVAVRCMALRCIGDVVLGNPNNLNLLISRQVGEGPQVESALNAIFRIVLRASLVQEFLAADYVFKCFCEKNPEGQTLLASTVPTTLSLAPVESANLPFGSLLLQALVSFESNGDSETCCRAASVLSLILKDNLHCKEKVLKIEIDALAPSLGPTKEPLLRQIVKYSALISSKISKENQSPTLPKDSAVYLLPLLLRLLVTWLADCPNAVACLLGPPTHLTYFLELVLNENIGVYAQGLTAVVLGECVIYNKTNENGPDQFAIADAISQKVGLTSYFLRFDELAKRFRSLPSASYLHSKPLKRTSTASMIEEPQEEIESEANTLRGESENGNPVILEIFDEEFVSLASKLETGIREGVMDIFSHTKSKVAVLPAELEQKNGEADGDYVKRLREFVERQCNEMQDLLARNATLAEELVRAGGSATLPDSSNKQSTGRERVQSESLRQDFQEATRRIEALKAQNSKLEADAANFKSLALKLESDLKSLSDAYNSLEQANVQLEAEVKSLRNPDLERIIEEAREEAQKETEGELNDLLVCLGQEQSKVERLSARLAELGEDVDKLLEGIGDDAALQDEDEDDE
ncbi:Golgin candidate 6 [Rhynchospora pubera]|uniref:Golgin candidate 6 n=1 Tax=Rhynchospora pubera TaxID=906938 RepID=A0AAV8C369_9POAL|nr:Golgin candidate 6 [Rhynchospora pubera]